MRHHTTTKHTYRIEFNRNKTVGDEIVYVLASNHTEAKEVCRMTFGQGVVITEVSQLQDVT